MFKVTQLWRGVAIALVLVPFAYIQKAKAIDWNVSGFIRQEGAFSLDSGKENYYNQGGNIFNDIDVPNQLAAPVQAALRANVPGLEAFVAPDATNRQQIIYSADGNHQTKSFAQDNDWNLIQTRFEIFAKHPARRTGTAIELDHDSESAARHKPRKLP